MIILTEKNMAGKVFKRRIICLALLLALIFIQVTGDVRLYAAESGTSVSDDSAVSEDDVIKDDMTVSEDAAISENTPQREDGDSEEGNEGEGETVSGPVPGTSDQIISENTAEEAEPAGAGTVSSGSCGAEGNNITWTITGNAGNYTLSFNGSGEMKDYIGDTGAYAPPWLEKYGSGITSVAFSGSITSLGSRACLDFKSLKKISLPDSLEKIGPYAFEGCASLSELSVGKNLAEIGYGAISSCTGLEVITVDPDNATYSDGNGSNVLITKSDMVLIKGSNKGTVPAGVTKIGDEAFNGCAGLKTCVLPDSVTEIGDEAFSSCTSLTEFTVPDSVTVLGSSAFYGCIRLTELSFSDNLTAIPAQCLYGCRNVKSVSIPAGVTEFGNSAFEGCRVLENINIPAGITLIPNACFRDCSKLKRIKLPEGVTKIDRYVFSGCNSLNVVGLPKSLSVIDYSAFCNDHDKVATSLSDVYYLGSEDDWSRITIESENDQLTKANIIFNTEMPDVFAVTSVSLDETEYTLEVGGFAFFRADAHPLYADNVDFAWSSSNMGVATVDQKGKVIALSPGTADITVTETGGKKDVCHVTVINSADDESLLVGWNTQQMFGGSSTGIYASTIKSYLYMTGSEYRILHCENGYYLDEDREWIVFLRYDPNKKLLYKRKIPLELPIWGGFYATDDAYYIVTGQSNYEESSEVECFRVTKYDLKWNRLGSAPLYGCNTRYPFNVASLRIAKKGEQLIVRTCHQMYVTNDGLAHQANATLFYDTRKMDIWCSLMEVDDKAIGYVSHSFNQFVLSDSDGVVFLDHGDAFPRALEINKTYQDITQGYLEEERDDNHKRISLMEFPGEIGDNRTGAAVNGFVDGKSRYIATGCSVVQDEENTKRKTFNIFVSTVDKDLRSTDIHWLTSAAEGERTYQLPQIAKISDDRFLVLWTRARNDYRWIQDGFVYYTEINENGERVTPIYRHKGELSDCVPIVEDGKVQWFTCNDKQVDFYGISTSDIRKFSINGTESDSGIDEPGGGDDSAEVTGVALNVHNATLYPRETLKLSAVVSPSDASNRAVSFNSSDPSVATVDLSGKVTAVSAGNAVITVTTVSGGKKDSMTLKVLRSEVADEDEDNNSPERNAGALWASGLKESYYYTGYAIKPEIRVYRGEKRLKEKTDYTITYKNCVKVTPSGAKDDKKARITVKLKGNYKGTKSFYYTILPMPLSELTADNPYAKYTKGVKNDSIRPTLRYNGNAVKYGDRDLTLEFFQGDSKSGCEEKGEYIIKITAGSSGCFTGSTSAKLTVADMTPISKVRVENLEKSYKYTGNPVIPDIELKDGNDVLAEGTDYTVSLENNVEIGRAVMTISGCGANYIGKRTMKFDIKGKYTLSGDDIDFVYDAGRSYYTYGGAKPEVTVTFRGKRLRKNIDYQVGYKYNKKLGSISDDKPPQAVIKGKGSYRTDEKTGIIKTFSIEPRPIADLVLVISDRAYSKNKNDYKKTKILFADENFRDQKLKKGKAYDYTVSFSVSDGSAAPKTGERITVSINAGSKGNYIGSATGSFRMIVPKQDIGKAEVKVNGGKACPYTGKSIEPGGEGEPQLELSMKNKSSVIRLGKGTDYDILGYYNNINKGKGVILLRGKGKYRGVRAVKFSIRASGWGEINKGITYNKTGTVSCAPFSDRR